MANVNNNPIRWQDGKYGMFLDAPYDKDFVDDLKLLIPYKDGRVWDNDRKQWWISDLYLDEADNIIFTHFGRYGEGRD